MGAILVIWTFTCFLAALAIEGTYNCWLIDKGEKFTRNVRKGCSIYIVVSFILIFSTLIIL